METSTLLNNISSSQLISFFNDLQNQLKDIKENFQPKEPIEFLTRTELAKLLKCDISTIHNWCKKGKLKPYGIGNRVYFKRAEIEEQIKPLNSI